MQQTTRRGTSTRQVTPAPRRSWEFFKQTGRNVGWLNEKANKAAPVATAVAVTAITAGAAAPVAAAIPGVATTGAVTIPAGAVLTGTVSGATGGAAGAFVAAKGEGATTEEAIEQARVGGFLGAIAGAVGTFTGIVTEVATTAKAAGKDALSRLAGAKADTGRGGELGLLRQQPVPLHPRP